MGRLFPEGVINAQRRVLKAHFKFVVHLFTMNYRLSVNSVGDWPVYSRKHLLK